MPRFSRFKGSFTMIEMIMVIVIAGVLIVSVLPRIDILYEMRVDGASKRLVSDVRYIQNLAMSRHAYTRIVFNTGAESYSASSCDSSLDCSVSGSWSAIPDPFTRQDLTVDFATDPQFSGVDISSASFNGTATLRFDWHGIPKDANNNNLTGAGGNSASLDFRARTRSISVTPQTGKVVVQ